MASWTTAAARTGAASMPRIDVVRMPQTKIGSRVQVIPGARRVMIVASMLIPDITNARAIRANPTM